MIARREKMKKKTLLATLFAILIAILAMSLTACSFGGGTLEKLQNELGVLVEGGGVEEGSELNFEIVTEAQADEIFGLLEDSGIALDDTTKAYIYDIFVTKENSEVQPDGNVKVTVPAPSDEKATGYKVYHVKDNGSVVSIPSTFKDGKIIFETDGFSCYVFTATYNVQTLVRATYSSVTIDTEANPNGMVSANGEAISGLYKENFEVGSIISLSAEAKEGYELYCWFIRGEETSTEHNEKFSYTVTSEDVSITAVFKPIITELALTYFDDVFVYDLDLAKDVETITVDQFCHERAEGEYYLVAGVLESFAGNGRITIKDEHGNVVQAELSDGVISTETYKLLRSKVNKFVALYGRKDENWRMTDASLSAFIPDFAEEQIKGVSIEGASLIEEGVYLIEGDPKNDIDWNTPGEYKVTYYLVSNPEISKTITVNVLGKSIEFAAWANNGTILLDGADVGSQYNSIFRNGYGSVTLTAKGGENTVFKGWYQLEGNDNTLVSKEPAYTFEFNKDTTVWCEFEDVASEIVIEGLNSGVDTISGVTNIYLPLDTGRVYDLTQIGVYVVIKGEPVYLTLDDYTIDAGRFDATDPLAGVYEITFTYNENPDLKAVHIIHVFGEEGAINVEVSVDDGGRLESELIFGQYNVGDKITLTVELRSESDFEFLGWYSVVIGESEDTSSETLLSTDRTYVHTATEDVSIRARIEPKITRIRVVGYEGNPTRINIEKFWMATREFRVYGYGALGKNELLSESEYTVDYGGLDLTAPVVGKYVITYTYNENPEVKYSVTVYVWDEDYSFVARPSSPNFGKLIFENEITSEAIGIYVEGEEVTVKAVANEGLTFAGWYTLVGQDSVLVSTEPEYTFVIDKDVELVAEFKAPVTSLSLDGVFMNNFGEYYIDIIEGDTLDLSSIVVLADSLIGSIALGENEYSIDYGDLDISALTAGSYTFMYTHKDSEAKVALTVNVYKRTYILNVTATGGRFEYDGVETSILSQYFEEGSVVVLKAMDLEGNGMRTFLGWYEYDKEDKALKLFSTDKSIAVTVDSAKKIVAKYGYAIVNMEAYDTDLITENGATYFNINGDAQYDQALGCYVCAGNVELETGSVYANDLSKLFEDLTLIATKSNGEIVEVSAQDLIIELGSYKAESGWYTIVVICGTLRINFEVFLWTNAIQ